MKRAFTICAAAFFLVCVAAGLSTAALSDGEFLTLCEKGTPEELAAAIREGANLGARDEYGKTPLMRAARFNPNPEMVKRLLEEGAEVDGANAEGFTPLMIVAALRTENPGPVVDLLLEGGADIAARDTYGWTALMRAAAQNANPEMVGLLLRAGADASLRNNDGECALDVAARNDALKDTEEYRMLEEASN